MAQMLDKELPPNGAKPWYKRRWPKGLAALLLLTGGLAFWYYGVNNTQPQGNPTASVTETSTARHSSKNAQARTEQTAANEQRDHYEQNEQTNAQQLDHHPLDKNGIANATENTLAQNSGDAISSGNAAVGGEQHDELGRSFGGNQSAGTVLYKSDSQEMPLATVEYGWTKTSNGNAMPNQLLVLEDSFPQLTHIQQENTLGIKKSKAELPNDGFVAPPTWHLGLEGVFGFMKGQNLKTRPMLGVEANLGFESNWSLHTGLHLGIYAFQQPLTYHSEYKQALQQNAQEYEIYPMVQSGYYQHNTSLQIEQLYVAHIPLRVGYRINPKWEAQVGVSFRKVLGGNAQIDRTSQLYAFGTQSTTERMYNTSETSVAVEQLNSEYIQNGFEWTVGATYTLTRNIDLRLQYNRGLKGLNKDVISMSNEQVAQNTEMSPQLFSINQTIPSYLQLSVHWQFIDLR